MAMAEEFLQSNHKSVANGEEVEENEAISDSKKRDRDIADWISRSCKPPWSNKNKESAGEK